MTKLKLKQVAVGGLIIVSLFFLFDLFGTITFEPHSSEYYELPFPEKDVIKAISTIKDENPMLQEPPQFRDADSTDQQNEIFFRLDDKILLTWTKPSGSNSTVFAFVSIHDETKWRTVNKDLRYFENKRVKKRFEKQVLSLIKDKLCD